jgi:hypothetical protein
VKEVSRGSRSTRVSDFARKMVDESQQDVSSVLHGLIDVRDDSLVLSNRRFSLTDVRDLIVCWCAC